MSPAGPAHASGPRAPAAHDLRGALRATGGVLLRLPRGLAVVVVVAWLGLISWFSSWPAQGVPSLGAAGFTTNLGHAFLFGLLALWCVLCLPRPGPRVLAGTRGAGESGKHAAVEARVAAAGAWPVLGLGVRTGLVVLVAFFGLLDETHQHLADQGRDFSLFDVVTDATGAWCVLAIAAYLRREGATEAGLVGRVISAVLACFAAAGLATWGPELWPGIGWF